MSGKRLVVNPIRCDAYGYCAERAPQLITLDQWGYPIIADGPVPENLLDAAERVVKECPRQALRLEPQAEE
jgi:ferredoxin